MDGLATSRRSIQPFSPLGFCASFPAPLQCASLRGPHALLDSSLPSLSGVLPCHVPMWHFEGHGTVWNLSLTGWRFSGNLPLRIGEVCSLTVNLPPQESLYVAAATVRWVQRGEDDGVETLVMDAESREEMEQYICQRVEDKWNEVHEQRIARLRRHEVERDC